MYKFLTFLCWAVVSGAMAAPVSPPAPDLMARIHFAGAGQISADPDAAAFTRLWCTPEAQALRNQTLNKLSRAPYTWLQAKVPAGAGDGTRQLRPLLDDLFSAEWFLQIRDGSNGSPEYALAIHLDAGQAQLWQASLESVLEAWTGMSVEKKPDGWSLKKHLPPNRFQFVRVGDWIIFGCGQDELPLNDEVVRRIKADKRPAPVEKDAWVSADLDWPRLVRWYPELKWIDLPQTQLRLVGRDQNLRLDGKLIFPQPLALTLEKWRMPTDAIRQPITSFTAVRGIAPWLKNQDWAQPYEISPVPNQMFIWSEQIPLQTFAAVPVPDSQHALREFAQKLSARPDWQSHFTLPVTMVVTNDQIAWHGLPFVAPNLRAVRGPSGDFLISEFFPNGPKTKQPLPPELYQELARTNLLCYHWEITPLRLGQLPHLTQLALMSTRHRQLDAHSAASKWLASIGPTLGSAMTEVTQTAPNELTFQRKAPGGLTAFELIALANWLEAPDFPGCDLLLPPAKPKPSHPRTNAPPAHPPGGPPPPTSH